MARVTAAAADEGMHWNTDAIQPSATFDAHRLLAFAATQDRQAGEHVQAALMDRLMTAYFAEGQLISQHTTLQAAGEAVGLAAADVAEGGAQAHDIGPHQNSRPASLARRMKQNRVAGAVGGFHLDIFFHDIRLGQGRRAGDPCAGHRHKAEAAP